MAAHVRRVKLRGLALFLLKKSRLMLRFRVLFDQQLNQRLKQGCASLPNIMDKLEETKIEREFLL